MKIFNKARGIAQILTDKMGADGFTLVQNNGIAQEVKHFHLHVIPKYNKKVSMNIEDVHSRMTK